MFILSVILNNMLFYFIIFFCVCEMFWLKSVFLLINDTWFDVYVSTHVISLLHPSQDWTQMSSYGKLQKSLKYDIFPLENSLCIFHTQKRAFPSESATEIMR